MILQTTSEDKQLLPDEIILNILIHLDIPDLIRFSLVNTLCNRLSKDKSFWAQRMRKDFSMSDDILSSKLITSENAKLIYQKLKRITRVTNPAGIRQMWQLLCLCGEVQIAINELGLTAETTDYYGRSAQHFVAFSGNLDAFSTLHQSNYDFISADNNGITPLHYAALSGNVIMMENLKQSDLKDTADDLGVNTTLYAAFSGSVKALEYCIANGADPLTRDKKGKGIVHYGAASGSIEMIDYLSNFGDGINLLESFYGNTNILFSAAQSGNLQLMKHLQEKYPEDFVTLLGSVTSKSRTVLHYACCSNNLEILKFCLELNPDLDLDASDSDGVRPIHFAVAAKFFDGVLYLVNKGALLDVVLQETPLPHFAAKFSNIEILSWLLEQYEINNGKKYSLLGSENRSIVLASATGRDPKNLAWLIDNGYPLEETKYGLTLIHSAAECENPELFDFVLQNAESWGLNPSVF